MKQSLIAFGLIAAGALAPQVGHAQQQCVLVCDPTPRVFCAPAGSLPTIIKYCRTAGSNAVAADASDLSLAPDLAPSGQNSCTAQEVFNEDTQTTEWQMVCD